MREGRMEKARKKLLKLLTRPQLEGIAKGLGNERPWHADRPTLEQLVMSRWPHADIAEEIDKLIDDAKGAVTP